MGLEEEFGISVEEESAQSIATVQDAADLIESLLEKWWGEILAPRRKEKEKVVFSPCVVFSLEVEWTVSCSACFVFIYSEGTKVVFAFCCETWD